MLQTIHRPLMVSHNLYLAILRENPDVPLERSRRGELIFMPPTGAQGSRRNASLTAQLWNWNEKVGGGKVFDSNGGFHLPDDATRAADAAWVERRRWDALTDAQRETFAPLCPDFVAELRSPSDLLGDLREKLEEYIENGARLGWLIDPFRKVVEIYRPDRKPETMGDVRAVSGEDVLVGFVLDLEAIFAD